MLPPGSYTTILKLHGRPQSPKFYYSFPHPPLVLFLQYSFFYISRLYVWISYPFNPVTCFHHLNHRFFKVSSLSSKRALEVAACQWHAFSNDRSGAEIEPVRVRPGLELSPFPLNPHRKEVSATVFSLVTGKSQVFTIIFFFIIY